VPQDPNDEPASELLKSIQTAKMRLVNEGVLKRNKSSITQHISVSFTKPKSWEIAPLGNIYDVRDGTHDTPKYVDSGYPLVTSKNLYTGKLLFDNIKYIKNEDHRKISERSLVEKNDILFAMIGSIGNPVIVDTDREFSIKNIALFKYIEKTLSNPQFLHLTLQAATLEMQRSASGGLQPFVSLGFLREYLVFLPPLTEQQRIVAKVDEIMAICDELDAQLKKTKADSCRLLEAVLRDALEPAGAISLCL
jgi:type I restriction enzyme S subunit